MSVIGGQRGADLVIGNDREIDEEAEYAGSEEVPKSDCSQEHDGPVVWEWRFRLLPLGGSQLQEAPGFKCEEGERYDFSSREESAKRHVNCRFSGEVHVVHRAHDAARGIEDDIEIDQAQRSAFVNYAQKNKDVGDEDGCEQLKEVFHPEMHDPEAPEIGSCEVLAGVRQQADAIEGGDGKREEEKEPRHVSVVFGGEPAAK